MSRLERIVAACGGILFDGGTRALIPGPGHSDKDRSVSLMESDGRILIHCFSPRNDWRSVRDLLRARGLLDGDVPAPDAPLRPAKVVVQLDNEERQARAERLWTESRAIRCTPASAYLNRRCILTGDNEVLRFHPRMTSIDDRLRRPALMAAIRNREGQLQGVQATLLTTYGVGKARVATPRRVIGRLLGGAVQLSPPAKALIVAEGVESALSVAEELGVPAWAALTAYNLSQFDPPENVRLLIAASDNDDAGRGALAVLQERLTERVTVEHAPAPAGFNDWNDWATKGVGERSA